MLVLDMKQNNGCFWIIAVPEFCYGVKFYYDCFLSLRLLHVLKKRMPVDKGIIVGCDFIACL
jgi:hypothetical protein